MSATWTKKEVFLLVLFLLFSFSCDSGKPQKEKDTDTGGGDNEALLENDDALVGDEDGLLPDGETTTEGNESETVLPEGELPPTEGTDTASDDDETTDDEAADSDEAIEDEDIPFAPDDEDEPFDGAAESEALAEDEVIIVDDAYVPPDTDSPIGCDDGVMCTEDVLEGGICYHLPRHDRCPFGELCNGEAGCVKPNNWVCRSCATSADCTYADDICAPLLGERFCFMPCLTNEECPPSFSCGDLYDTNGSYLGTGCSPNNFTCCLDLDGDGAGVGAKCALNDCDESSAQIRPGAVEVCNGKDDNCDGQEDNNLGTPPLCEKQSGVCQGSRKTCGGPAGWLPCTTATYAAWNSAYEEVETLCDGKDNDCNGILDDPFASNLQKICVVGVGECRRAGFTVCNATHDGVECNAIPGSPTSELCNEKDDDCDGIVDNGFDGKGSLCFAGLGACLRAGIYTCSADGWAIECNAVPGTPTTEVCNGIDDNCNGTPDDGVTASAPNCANQNGVCAGTKKPCGGANGWLECGQSEYAANPNGTYEPNGETLCDGKDNDCDGTPDDNLTNYAPACENPVAPATPLRGVCVGARKACGGASGWLTCGAAQFGPDYQATENRCDYLDNDCDGTVDEGYLNPVTGKYDQNTACGNCATDCTAIYAKPNAYGTCDASGDPVCVMNCNTNTFNLNGVPDDGCEFVLDTTAIYVSTSDASALDVAGCGLGPSTTGGGRFPCKTISYGLSRASATGRTKVLVADGTYEETVTLVAGKNLYGGYRPDTWARHLSTTMTIIRGNDNNPSRPHWPHKITINATNITTATVVEGFVIYGEAATEWAEGIGGYGGNSYAIYVTGSNNQLTIRNNTIYGAAGAPGKSRPQAAAGANGGNGGGRDDNPSAYDPIQGNGRNSGCTTTRQHTNGGVSTCGAAGGHGGGNFCYPVADSRTSARDGNPGSGAGAGAGGTPRGYDGEVVSVTYNPPYNLDCKVPPGTMNGANGSNGSNGSNGGGGAGCTGTTGSVSGGHWRGTDGGNGAAGTAGGGGGGGASGGGGDSSISSVNDVLGGHGGGGGAGGCGGQGGQGGAPGGGSFAIFITASVTTAPVIQNNTIFLGSGGTGGSGGGGGAGGQGGIGGKGGLTINTPPLNCGGQGGNGGNGGNGGAGGGGGGGCGGTAVGIGYSGVAPTMSGNTFSGGQGGAGGQGGPSMGNAGTAGATGSVANTRAY